MSGVISYIKDKYSWFIAPNPTHDESYIRISHMGDISSDKLLTLADRIEEACLSMLKKNS